MGRDCPQKGIPALAGGLKICFHQQLKTFSPGVFPESFLVLLSKGCGSFLQPEVHKAGAVEFPTMSVT